jgi:hypothetical protein
MSPALHHEDAQLARVVTAQHLLFPSAPRVVCTELGLNWWAAIKLYEEGWLSFCPEETTRLDEAQEAELRFVGSLVIAGCDRPMLSALLEGLQKPYAYHGHKLYYQWAAREWRLLPDPNSHPEAVFIDWLERLVEREDIGSVTGILELAHDALSRIHSKPAPARLQHKF